MHSEMVPTHAGCNLAEIGNASWKTTGTNLSLLEAAKDDVTFFIMQDEANNYTCPVQ